LWICPPLDIGDPRRRGHRGAWGVAMDIDRRNVKLPFTHRLPEENHTSAASRSKPYSHAPNARLVPRALEPVTRFPFYLSQPHSAAMVHLHLFVAGPDRNNGNVVFVHGLDGHWIETWGGASTQISGLFFGRAGLPRTCRSWPSTPWNTTRTQPGGTAAPSRCSISDARSCHHVP
jgi:hypothetical protein